MIMMRSNPPTKINKPPPPVPPRPSKSIVAEALAKTRRYENVAPPPPKPQISEKTFKCAPVVVKSQSYSSVNNYDKIVSKIDRGYSVEDPPKPATRTLVYQSSNVRKGTVEQIRVNLNRKESFKRENNISRTNSFKTPVAENVCKISLSNTNTANNKKLSLSRDSSLESLGESDDQHLSRSSSFKTNEVVSSDSVISEDDNKLDNNWNEITDRNHVNTLIDEMFASVLELPDDKTDPVQVINDNVTIPEQSEKVAIHTFKAAPVIEELVPDSQKTVLVIENDEVEKKVHFEPTKEANSNSSTAERKIKVDDQLNHELLISELANMKKEQDRILKRQRKPSQDIYDGINGESKIHHSDWVEVNNGQEIRLSSCQITIENDENLFKTEQFLSRHGEMSNLHGLPPLPKSLSGFNLIENSPQTTGRPSSSRNVSPAGYPVYPHHQKNAPNGEVGSLKKANNLDAKLALLRREMYSLRQLDLSLLSQLWSLNESIQDFRHILQEQDERNVLSPPSPSPTPSSGEDADGDEFYSLSPMRFRPAPPPPPHRRPSNSSTGTGSSV